MGKEKLKAEGITTIINLRTADEYNVAQEFLKIMSDTKNRPVFIHCTAAIRVGAFWLIKRVIQDNWTFEKAEQEAQQVGLRNAPHLTEFAKAYIEKHRKK